MRTSYVAPGRRVLIAPGKQRPTSRNALGGRLRAQGLAQLGWCDPDRGFGLSALEPQRPPVRRCPGPRANRAAPATQRLDVVLRDRSGRHAAMAAERISSALYPSAGSRMRQLRLNDVRIPLGRFRGVDLHRLAAVELRFGVRGRRTGSIQLADMDFQR